MWMEYLKVARRRGKARLNDTVRVGYCSAEKQPEFEIERYVWRE